MPRDDIVTIGLQAMKRAGAEKAQAHLVLSEKCELDVEAGEIKLLRTTVDARLTLDALKGGKRGSTTRNRVDRASVEAAAGQALAAADAAAEDSAQEIAPAQEQGVFGFGHDEPELDTMHAELAAFLALARQRFPTTRLEQCLLDFTHAQATFANSNGVRFETDTGIYGFVAVFTTKNGRKSSSFNYSDVRRRELGEPLETWGQTGELLRQSAEQLDAKPVEGKFVGDIIVTPDCLVEILAMITRSLLGDEALIKGTSPLRDSLGTPVASPLFTLRSCPVGGAIQDGAFFTPDGFAAADTAYIDGGVLRDFGLSFYGSRKTGKVRSPSGGGCWVVDPGAQDLQELIGSVEQGLLLCRYSGSDPSDNGDFSGVAKNSYLIRSGRVERPVTETMIAGNLAALLRSSTGVSRQRVDLGTAVLPWIRTGGVTISGR
jgi:PmbA protein